MKPGSLPGTPSGSTSDCVNTQPIKQEDTESPLCRKRRRSDRHFNIGYLKMNDMEQGLVKNIPGWVTGELRRAAQCICNMTDRYAPPDMFAIAIAKKIPG